MPASEVMDQIVSEPAARNFITSPEPKPSVSPSRATDKAASSPASPQALLPALPLPGEDCLLRKISISDIREHAPIYQRRRTLPFNRAKANGQLRGPRSPEDELQRLEKELIELKMQQEEAAKKMQAQGRLPNETNALYDELLA